MTTLEKYELWCNSSYFDDETKEELKGICNNQEEIEDRFYKDLEFGTGGLRGIIGAGTNRMNLYTVRKATQGLANYIKQEKGEKKGVAIAYDSRNMSKEFAKEAALCFAGNGIRVYLFSELRPTPMLSFAVRQLKCIAGVVITASHNPAEYNGYKVYWEDGAQITYPRDKEIISEVKQVNSYNEIHMISEKEAVETGLLRYLERDIEDLYMDELKKLVLSSEEIKKQSKNLKIVYTPLHGTGNVPVRRILKELGFEHVYVVKEQELPDGNFSTVEYPNPEDKNAFKMALELAREVEADIVLATDPDADRLGVYAKHPLTGEYIPFTGNMSASLMLEYEITRKKELDILSENSAIVTTIVSGKMGKDIANYYQLSYMETLTGFKYIGEKIHQFERENSYEFLFGYEESYGCLLGTYARDKDAVVAVMLLCEMAAYYKDKGISLCEQMEYLYQKYGYHQEELLTVILKGKDGAKQISNIMEEIRKNPLKKIGEYTVEKFYDYEQDIAFDIKKNKKTKTGLPKSNVLYFQLEGNSWCCIRPSGTEPKVKCYIGVKEDVIENSNLKIQTLTKELEKLLKNEAS